MEHFVRPDGLPPVSGYSHAVAFHGRTVGSLVQVSGLVHPDFRVEIEALAVLGEQP